MDVMNFQECLYPDNHIKMRCLENHDQPRIYSFVANTLALENYTAFLYFQKGTTLLYGGQEFCCDTIPSLFDKDVFLRDTTKDISHWFPILNRMKKELLSASDTILCSADDANDIAIMERKDTNIRKLGVFSLKGNCANVSVSFPDGEYTNYLGGSAVKIEKGSLRCNGKPIVIMCNA